eukprot:CAMPEP_0204530576 /NCGR_PEP_ID=MMETSP0661-20131031/10699_1 /ASSEMBLY_ACC=CAM_ASM_000606 /TAXON_ID=109239 /ORGANISM="Alexandrium margalefi, Strain AMGDE01CS-322" /LENGTH=217 /DNA_ID=CAMNT_0051536675 /DNA_START=173 /DNA_END=822 /DNA_ORIENTATION=+
MPPEQAMHDAVLALQHALWNFSQPSTDWWTLQKSSSDLSALQDKHFEVIAVQHTFPNFSQPSTEGCCSQYSCSVSPALQASQPEVMAWQQTFVNCSQPSTLGCSLQYSCSDIPFLQAKQLDVMAKQHMLTGRGVQAAGLRLMGRVAGLQEDAESPSSRGAAAVGQSPAPSAAAAAATQGRAATTRSCTTFGHTMASEQPGPGIVRRGWGAVKCAAPP